VRAIRKCADLLMPGGLLWISTPNFESAYARLARDTDPIWRVVEHMHYFSDRSLHKVHNAHGLRPRDYRLSRHYNGSMEVIAVRES
jgi:2-polyprenyl-3-methyl-5-hydroxy-6-metoxy-1,4-benzoquinol methylase